MNDQFEVTINWTALAYKIRLNFVAPLRTFFYFQWVAFLAIRNKIILIDTDTVKSKGGYKYVGIVISKRPLSPDHTYEEF